MNWKRFGLASQLFDMNINTETKIENWIENWELKT